MGDEPPRAARGAARARLPAAQGARGRTAIVTRPPGYVLESGRTPSTPAASSGCSPREEALAEAVPSGGCDAARRARALARAGARGLRVRAVRPGRGRRLEELRGALEERIEADLALGRHAELVGELEALVAAAPAARAPARQLMLALYRAGRQADALAAYREARTSLVDELGLEPGRALRELEAAILRQDPALEPPADARSATRGRAAPVPGGTQGRDGARGRLLRCAVVGTVLDPERVVTLIERVVAAIGRDRGRGRPRREHRGSERHGGLRCARAQEDHVERALPTALALRGRLDGRFGDGLAVRLGVETGEVVGGRLGLAGGPSPRRAWPGPSRPGRSSSVSDCDAARGLFEFGRPLAERPRPAARDSPAAAGARPEPHAPAAAGASARSSSGARPSETLLRAAYARVVSRRRPRLVTGAGDAGVGKTHLVRELWEGLAGETPEPVASDRPMPRTAGHDVPAVGGRPARAARDAETESPEPVRRRLGGAGDPRTDARASTADPSCTRSTRASACRRRGSSSSRS